MSGARLTLAHLENWLDGQIQFGIDENKQGRYVERYLVEHLGWRSTEPIRFLIRRLPETCTPRELKERLRLYRDEKHHAKTSVHEIPRKENYRAVRTKTGAPARASGGEAVREVS